MTDVLYIKNCISIVVLHQEMLTVGLLFLVQAEGCKQTDIIYRHSGKGICPYFCRAVVLQVIFCTFYQASGFIYSLFQFLRHNRLQYISDAIATESFQGILVISSSKNDRHLRTWGNLQESIEHVAIFQPDVGKDDVIVQPACMSQRFGCLAYTYNRAANIECLVYVKEQPPAPREWQQQLPRSLDSPGKLTLGQNGGTAKRFYEGRLYYRPLSGDIISPA